MEEGAAGPPAFERLGRSDLINMAAVEVSGSPAEVVAPEKPVITKNIEHAVESSPEVITEIPKVDSVNVSEDSKPATAESPAEEVAAPTPEAKLDESSTAEVESTPAEEITPKAVVDETPTEETKAEEIPAEKETPVADEVPAPATEETPAEAPTEEKPAVEELPAVEESATAKTIDVAPDAKEETPSHEHAEAVATEDSPSVEKPEETPAPATADVPAAAATDGSTDEKISTPVEEKAPEAEAQVNAVTVA
eukprot:Gb_32003 [translate_table: standard]